MAMNFSLEGFIQIAHLLTTQAYAPMTGTKRREEPRGEARKKRREEEENDENHVAYARNTDYEEDEGMERLRERDTTEEKRDNRGKKESTEGRKNRKGRIERQKRNNRDRARRMRGRIETKYHHK